MKSFVAATLALALLGGCVVAPNSVFQEASHEERVAAMAGYQTCIWAVLPKVDDGLSDAKTIAHGLRGACSYETMRVTETLTRSFNARQTEMYRQRGEPELEFDLALQTVLRFRAAARK